jgi:hypothetical protein
MQMYLQSLWILLNHERYSLPFHLDTFLLGGCAEVPGKGNPFMRAGAQGIVFMGHYGMMG